MTEADELQRAVEQAEAEAAALEQQLETLTAQRHAHSEQALLALETRKAELADSLRALSSAQRW